MAHLFCRENLNYLKMVFEFKFFLVNKQRKWHSFDYRSITPVSIKIETRKSIWVISGIYPVTWIIFWVVFVVYFSV